MKHTQPQSNESGQTLLLVALSLTILLGLLALVVDVGMAYSEYRRMQNATDAAALAGASVMAEGGTDAQIRNAVQQYAVNLNGADTYQAVYTPGNQTVGGGSVPSTALGVRVTANVNFPTFLAGLMGFNNITAEADATGGFSPLDIMLVLDRSGSMDDDSCSRQPYPTPPPWPTPVPCPLPIDQTNCTRASCGGTWTLPPQSITAAKDAAKAFVDLNNPNLTHIGLASYGDNYTLNRHLTSNFSAVKTSITALTASGCTNTAGGLATARNELMGSYGRPDAVRFIVFLTDGLPNKGLTSGQTCSSCPDYCPAAKQAARDQATIAASNGIIIYSIGLSYKADMALMQDIADISGGEAFFAPTGGDLLAIYQTIFERIRVRLTE